MTSAPRIVSLLPSATEIVAALGFGDHLVGRSHECDHPAGVEQLPVVTRPKLPLDGTSYQIDQRVRAVLQEALSVYRVDAAILARLDPVVIITQNQCEVCAVSEAEVLEVVRDVLGDEVEVVSLEPNSLDGVLDDVKRVARALGAPGRGDALAAEMLRRIDLVALDVAGARRPRVVCLEWTDPLMAAGNWMPTLVERAGGENVLGEAGAHSPWIDWATVRDADPDVIVILPCGFDLDRSEKESAVLRDLPGWDELRAVRDGRVHVTDGHAYFNRPGPRLVESTEILAEVLHPDRFSPARFEGSGWRRFT